MSEESPKAPSGGGSVAAGSPSGLKVAAETGRPVAKVEEVELGPDELRAIAEATSWHVRTWGQVWGVKRMDRDGTSVVIPLGLPLAAATREEVVAYVSSELSLVGHSVVTNLVEAFEPASTAATPQKPAPVDVVIKEEKGVSKYVVEEETPVAIAGPAVRPGVVVPWDVDFSLTQVVAEAKAEGRKVNKSGILAEVHRVLEARVASHPGVSVPAGHSLMAGRLLIPDVKLRGLRVVGIGAADSSGNRGRYARIVNVTKARVAVTFEDGEAGEYFVKEKAEPVDKLGYSLIDGNECFSPKDLEEAERLRRQARSKNKQKAAAPKGETRSFLESEEESEPEVLPRPAKRLRTDAKDDFASASSGPYWERAMTGFGIGVRNLVLAGAIPKAAAVKLRAELEFE